MKMKWIKCPCCEELWADWGSLKKCKFCGKTVCPICITLRGLCPECSEKESADVED